jgi:hypothetical protein
LKDYSMALFHYKRALTHPDSSNAEKIQKAISSLEIAPKSEATRRD